MGPNDGGGRLQLERGGAGAGAGGRADEDRRQGLRRLVGGRAAQGGAALGGGDTHASGECLIDLLLDLLVVATVPARGSTGVRVPPTGQIVGGQHQPVG